MLTNTTLWGNSCYGGVSGMNSQYSLSAGNTMGIAREGKREEFRAVFFEV